MTPPASTCRSLPLGPATEYDVFALGDLELRNGDSDGNLAACGNATLLNFGVGTAARRGIEALVVDGNLDFGFGMIYGDAVVGGAANFVNAGFGAGGRLWPGHADACENALPRLTGLCASLDAMPANGATHVQYGIVRFTGRDPGLNVFAATTSELAVANTIAMDVPAGSTAIVNVSGAMAGLRHLGFLGHDGARVLYAFCDAVDLTLNGVGVEASILAPGAAVVFANGTVSGQLAAGSVRGAGTFRARRFEGCVPPETRSATGGRRDRLSVSEEETVERLQRYERSVERRRPVR